MKEVYLSPEVNIVVFEKKDVITTSGDSIINTFSGEPANSDTGWTGLY